MRWHRFLGLTADRQRPQPAAPAVAFVVAGAFAVGATAVALARNHGSGRWFGVLLLGALAVLIAGRALVTIRRGSASGQRPAAPAHGWRYYLEEGLAYAISFGVVSVVLDTTSAVVRHDVIGQNASDLPVSVGATAVFVALAVAYKVARRRGRPRRDGAPDERPE